MWADRLPDFPWDLLAPAAARARTHPDGLIDLSIGTPIDSVPLSVQEALRRETDAPGYPQTHGTVALREAAAGWLARTLDVAVAPDVVLPTIGSKELIATLPMLLGARPGTRVLLPALAYPTYDVGARVAGCVPVPCDSPPASADGVALVWLNSPSNPTGEVLSVAQQRVWVEWGQRHGVPIASDECYVELGWEARPVSVLHRSVCGDSMAGLLAVHSLSKRSNLAGYRAGIVTGDPRLVAGLLEVRKHVGLMVPLPVQAAMAAAFGDDAHVAEQRARYAMRRAALRPALEAAGFRIDHSAAGLYLWATRGEDCQKTLDWFADRGILVAPGTFYGVTGGQHVRVALTVSDERVTAVVERLAGG